MSIDIVPEGMDVCPHCTGYGSSLQDPIGVNVCTVCGGKGLVSTNPLPYDLTKEGLLDRFEEWATPEGKAGDVILANDFPTVAKEIEGKILEFLKTYKRE